MIKICILLTTFFIALSFQVNSQNQQVQTLLRQTDTHHPQSQLQDCTDGQKNAITNVLTICEVSDLETTVDCISNQTTKTYQNQQWNIFAKNTATNQDSVMFWRYDNCLIKLENYGKFNRTYIMWPAKSYANVSSEITTNKKTEEQKMLRHNKISPRGSSNSLRSLGDEPNVDCPLWKKNTISQIIKLCSIDTNPAATACIYEKVKQQTGEYWNVSVQTSILGTQLSYFYYICSIQTDGSDSYRRFHYVWKARP